MILIQFSKKILLIHDCVEFYLREVDYLAYHYNNFINSIHGYRNSKLFFVKLTRFLNYELWH